MSQSAWRRKHDADMAKGKKLQQEFNNDLRTAEAAVRKLADAVVANGKYSSRAHARTAEFLNDAMRSIRACLTGEDRLQRR